MSTEDIPNRTQRAKNREQTRQEQQNKEEQTHQKAAQAKLTRMQQLHEQLTQSTTALQTALDRITTLENAANQPPPAPPPQAHPNYNGESLFAAGNTIKPTIFFGGYNPSATEWFNRFEEIARAHKWEGNRRSEVVQLFFDGGARLAYRALPDATKNNYDQLKAALIQVLEPVESPRFFSQLLYGPKARKKQATENVSTYAADIQKYVQGAHPVTATFPAAAQNQIMREAFIGGLPPDMKQAVMDKDPTNFDEALHAANKIEARNFLIKGEFPKEAIGATHQSFAIDSHRQNYPPARTQNYSNTFEQPHFQNNRNNTGYRYWQPRQNSQFSNNRQPDYQRHFRNSQDPPYNSRFSKFQSHPDYRSQNNNQRGYNRYPQQKSQQYSMWCSYHQSDKHNTRDCRARNYAYEQEKHNRPPQKQNYNANNDRYRPRQTYRPPQNRRHVNNVTFDTENSDNDTSEDCHDDSTALQNLFRNFESKLSTKIEANDKKVESLQQLITESRTAHSLTPASFQAYPLTSNTEKQLCAFHTYKDWEELSTTCKENLECPYGHNIQASCGRTRCSEPHCPCASSCAVCCLYFKCQICKPKQAIDTVDIPKHTQSPADETGMKIRSTTEQNTPGK